MDCTGDGPTALYGPSFSRHEPWGSELQSCAVAEGPPPQSLTAGVSLANGPSTNKNPHRPSIAKHPVLSWERVQEGVTHLWDISRSVGWRPRRPKNEAPGVVRAPGALDFRRE
jgi:hypothetical protein